ncbi:MULTISPECIES: carbohydrate ABC transporter permease [Deefgea]|uniref:ABC transporter permease subunit n=1 Tax=Deefgea chitinilytica TaxID=570276 RepID=A0ABS2CEZ0_9NEIS|nr:MULTISPECIES: carbohydrate ABC transporter permease [Deefgea]MBM5572709.1 ABC transporter permease subunit [Deefgea chitinilytica]MBM9889945.1 carbohydrate ABC transporter permease [Deefgea sp. CFH1-16]
MTQDRFWRAIIYSALVFAALYYLIPLYVMLTTSVKSMEEIRAGNLLAFPQSISFAAWEKAWSTACTGVSCEGLSGYFLNSVKMVIPAVLISTVLGAINGYVLSKWRFPGSNVVFAMILFGVFMPFQVLLLPMAQTLGWLGIASTTTGLVFVHVVCGLASTTLFFRNYYVGIPDELIKAARLDGAGFWRIFWRIILPMSTPIIMVTLIWQFTQIWNDFLFGVVFSAGDSQPITVGLNNMANTSTTVKEYNVDMAAALIAALPTIAVYVFCGKYFVRGLSAGAVKG